MHQQDYYFGTGTYAVDAFKNTADEKKLSAAIDKNDIKYVQDYIARGGDVNAREVFTGSLPRHPVIARAATQGRTEIVEALLKAGAQVHHEWQFDAFVEAAREGNVKTVEAFIKAGIDVNKSPFALNRAIAFNEPEVVKLLISAKADLSEALSGSGPTRAADHLAMTELLLNAGANTESRNYLGYTPLMEERDPQVRKQRQAEIGAIARDPVKARAFLLETSMIDSVRNAAAITLDTPVEADWSGEETA